MGALTLGIVVPSTPPQAATATAQRFGGPAPCNPERTLRAALETAPWQRHELLSCADLMDAARSLGVETQLLRVPAQASEAQMRSMMSTHFAELDRLMVVAHGPAGGTGKLHRAARSAGLPVLGAEPQAIATAYDKLLCRQRLSFRNLPVPRSVALSADRAASIRALEQLGWPAVLKPRRGAAGAGVMLLGSPRDLDALASLEPELLVERRMLGREISVVLLDGALLGMAEVTREIGPGGSKLRSVTVPPKLDPIARRGLANVAVRAARELGLDAGPTCVDLILSPRDNEVILEVEPLPPVHRDSLVARVARAEGLSYPELFARVFSGPRAPRASQGSRPRAR